VTVEPDTATLATVVLDEVAVRLPETLETAIAADAPVSRPNEVGLAVIAVAAVTMTGTLIVVLPSFRVIWTEPAALAITVTLEPDTETVAILVLPEVAVRLPETLLNVITEDAPMARLNEVGLAVIAVAALTVTGIVSVVLLSLSVIWTLPAFFAVTVAVEPDIETEATSLLEDVALTLPEALLKVMAEDALTTRLSEVGLALMTGAALTVTGMVSEVFLSLTLICAVPTAFAVTLILPFDRLALTMSELLDFTSSEPETLFNTNTAVASFDSVNEAGEAVMIVDVLLFFSSASDACETNSSGAISTANPRINRLYVMTTS
jgi:hypothetical protein